MAPALGSPPRASAPAPGPPSAAPDLFSLLTSRLARPRAGPFSLSRQFCVANVENRSRQSSLDQSRPRNRLVSGRNTRHTRNIRQKRDPVKQATTKFSKDRGSDMTSFDQIAASALAGIALLTAS